MNESILITGANIGLGKETARQFALKKETKKSSCFAEIRRKQRLQKRTLSIRRGRRFLKLLSAT
ncbi:NAD(P)-dependent dehydrogenase (short-subunit alcohol dehydrogenase family) [Oxalobacteraceae bacterium GrIS 1.18]